MSRSSLARILIADNDEEVLVALERILEDEGYSTATAIGHEDASRMLSRDSFDLMILDDHLSGQRLNSVSNGIAAFRRYAKLVIVTYHLLSVTRRPSAVAFTGSERADQQACSL